MWGALAFVWCFVTGVRIVDCLFDGVCFLQRCSVNGVVSLCCSSSGAISYVMTVAAVSVHAFRFQDLSVISIHTQWPPHEGNESPEGNEEVMKPKQLPQQLLQ